MWQNKMSWSAQTKLRDGINRERKEKSTAKEECKMNRQNESNNERRGNEIFQNEWNGKCKHAEAAKALRSQMKCKMSVCSVCRPNEWVNGNGGMRANVQVCTKWICHRVRNACVWAAHHSPPTNENKNVHENETKSVLLCLDHYHKKRVCLLLGKRVKCKDERHANEFTNENKIGVCAATLQEIQSATKQTWDKWMLPVCKTIKQQQWHKHHKMKRGERERYEENAERKKGKVPHKCREMNNKAESKCHLTRCNEINNNVKRVIFTVPQNEKVVGEWSWVRYR